MTILPIVIGTLSPRMKKAWYGRLLCLTVLDEHSCWPSLVLLTSCGKRCLSKLREAAESWLRRPKKDKRTKENNDNNNRHWAVSLARYVDGGGGGYWIEKTPQDLGHRTKEFIRRSCVARLQVPRKVGEMALVSIDDSVNQARTHR